MPPRAFPLGQGNERPPNPAWGVVSNCQSNSVPKVVPYQPGTSTCSLPSTSGPASRTPTLRDGFSERRAATAKPAVPPPTMMKSKWWLQKSSAVIFVGDMVSGRGETSKSEKICRARIEASLFYLALIFAHNLLVSSFMPSGAGSSLSYSLPPAAV